MISPYTTFDNSSAGQEIDPFDDHHASSTYRRRLAAILVEDALAEAAQRARREN